MKEKNKNRTKYRKLIIEQEITIRSLYLIV